MAEIKTCEQYVLDRLRQVEEENDALKTDNHIQATYIDGLKAEIQTLKEFLLRKSEICQTGDGEDIIDLETIWKKYDSADYAYLLEILKEQKKED